MSFILLSFLLFSLLICKIRYQFGIRAVVFMAGGRRRKTNVEEAPVHERDLRDIEIEELRRQVQQLQQLQPFEHEESYHDEESSQDDGEDVNPFHRVPSQSSSNKNIFHRRIQRNNQFQQEKLNMKVDMPEFEGRMQPNEFLDWLHTVDRIFEYKEVPENQKVKLVAIKLKKYASLWWENLRRQRAHEGRSRIVTWEKMKKELKRKFLPDNFRQDNFLKFHNFKQQDLSVEDYTMEFDHLMLKCNVNESEEQIIARYLGGLKTKIANIVQLQPYWTYNDVVKLAIKVEKQGKDVHGNVQRSSPNVGISSGEIVMSSKPNPSTNSKASKPSPKDESAAGSNHPSASKTNSRKCFKCQGFGHIASDCPNRNMVTLIEEDIEVQKEDDSAEEQFEAKEISLMLIKENLS